MTADDEDDEADEGPAVALGEGAAVDGAPIARIAARLSWPQERSSILEKVGEERIRTPDGGRSLADILEETETTYFASRREFLDVTGEATGDGPIPTED